MAVYLAIICVALVLAAALRPDSNKANAAFYVVIVFAILILFSSVRDYSVGNDTLQYVSVYRNAAILPIDSFDLQHYEIGFVLLCKLLNIFSSDPRLLLVISSLVSFGSIGLFIYKKSPNIVFSTLFIVLMQIYPLYISAMRQALAFSFVLIAFLFLEKNKKLAYALMTLLAISMHTSAICAAMLLPLTYLKSFSSKTVGIAFAVTLIAIVLSPVLQIIVGTYIDQKYLLYEAQSGINLASILTLAVFVLLAGLQGFFYNKAYGPSVDRGNVLLQSTALLALPIAALALQTSFFSRLVYYFGFFYALAYPALIMKLGVIEKRVTYVILTGLMVAYFLSVSILRPEWFGVIPYTSFILGIEVW